MLKRFMLMILLVLAPNCGTKQPKVADESQKNPKTSLTHLNLKTGCQDCHEAERPAPYEDLVSIKHGEGAACESCHTWPSFKAVVPSLKAHNPYPTQCLGCHSRALEMSTHGAQGDCKACHRFPMWSPAVIGG